MTALKCIVLACIIYFSFSGCKKSGTVSPPSPADSTLIFGFKDSTLLVKSYSYIITDSASGTIGDSATRYFYYDTLNKKIIISQQQISNSSQTYDGIEFTYNSLSLLSHIENKYSTQVPVTSNIFTADYLYDNNNVLKSASVKLLNGSAFTIAFTKTPLASGGYQLSWLDTSPNSYPDSMTYIVNVDNNDRLLSYYYIYADKTYYTDSVIYDASGSASKIIETDFLDVNNPGSSTIVTRFDFTSRDTKGDQFYNIRRVVYNGLNNLPNTLSYSFTGFGQFDEFEYEYSKYPVLNTIIYQENSSQGIPYFVNFNCIPQYDSKNRLVKYHLFQDDAYINTEDDVITYYK